MVANYLSTNNSELSCNLGIYNKRANITLNVTSMLETYQLEITYSPAEEKASLVGLIFVTVIGFIICFVFALLCCKKDTEKINFGNISLKKIDNDAYNEFDIDYIYEKNDTVLKDFAIEKQKMASLKSEENLQAKG